MIAVFKINDPNLINSLAHLMSKVYANDSAAWKRALDLRLQPILSDLRDDIVIIIENNYVDKFYRDSYYFYFSSKAESVPRNCIRLSLFDNSSNVFENIKSRVYKQIEEIEKNYLGFIILRPTIPAVVGRSAINPVALKQKDFKCCLTRLSTSSCGIKTSVEAFPFSSQDIETITCAETTLWALLEYYGNKYVEYTPILPSDIVKNLESTIAARQLPSSGLTVQNLTYALKTFGFEPQLYACAAFGHKVLNNILSCYIESGIPVIVALSNSEKCAKEATMQQINHAVLCIGHENITDDAINVALANNVTKVKTHYGTVSILDFDDIVKKFVFIDDNCSPYQKDFLATPANHYMGRPDWQACEISNFIAPLHKRIYMDAFVAKNYSNKLLNLPCYSHLNGTTVVSRTYLCSTRSFRHFVNGSCMTDDMKDIIGGVLMPKFVWVTEISDVNTFKKGLVDNLIIVDATGYETSNYKPLLVAFGNQLCVLKNQDTKILTMCKLKTNQFQAYSNLR